MGSDQQTKDLRAEIATRDLSDPFSPENVLDPREKGALTYFRSSGAYPVSTDTAERMFFLFLRGLSTEDIRKLTPGFSLAQIVHARVAGRWDQRRAEYDAKLVTTGVETVNRARLELAVFLGDALAAATTVGRERLQRYALSRDEKDLGGLEFSTIKDLKGALELLLKATGQDKPAAPGGPPVNVTGEGATVNILHATGGPSLADLVGKKRGARGGEG